MSRLEYDDRWWDGVCNLCGYFVEEKPSTMERDYMNRCTNPKCAEHDWHDVYDDELLDYYRHKGEL
jgi:hypothetical protein